MTPTMSKPIKSIERPAQASEHLKKSGKEVKDQMQRNSVEYYKELAYPVELVQDDESYVASNPDLPGCISFGETPNEAVENLQEVRTLWIEGQLASGNTIPEPSAPERYSGKFVLRIPKTLHRMVDTQARREGVSLNTYITSIVASGLAYQTRANVQPSLGHERITDWRRPIHGWETGRFGNSWQVHGISSNYGLFVGLVAQQVGNSSVERLDRSERGDFHYV